MPTAATHTATYRVTSINEAGAGRVNVNFVQELEGEAGSTLNFGTNPISLNLTAEEAASYFPGQTYTVTFTPTVTA